MIWLLIVYLHTGDIGSVTVVDNVVSCVASSFTVMNADSKIKSAKCITLVPEREA